MNIKHFVLALGVAGLGAMQQVTAVNAFTFTFIDQNQPDNGSNISAFSQRGLAQSFQTQQNNVSGAGIYVRPFLRREPNNITISLWDNLPNAGGTQLATATTSGVTLDAFNDVFWNPVTVTANQSYYLVFTSDNNQGVVTGSEANPYANGLTYANNYTAFPRFDYTFRTYSDSSDSPATPVPEPSSALGTFVLGAIGVGTALKRKQQKKAAIKA